MCDDPVAKESRPPLVGVIDELIDHHQVARRDRLLHAAGRADRDQPLRTEHLHAIDVRSIVKLGRQNPMALAVTREEDHLDLAYLTAIVSIGRRPERRIQLDLLDQFEARHPIEATPANYSQYRSRHLRRLPSARRRIDPPR